MSNLVLGGVGFSRLTRSETDRFLRGASDIGILSIDTAPAYGNSEEIIGSYKRIKDWQVSTKVGYPNGPNLNRKRIQKSIDNSLANLNIERIHTCFIHSMQNSNIDEDLIDSLTHLQFSGKIQYVGYSGDGTNLNSVLSSQCVDKIMTTLNILDLSNLQTIRNFGSENVLLKRVLCNSVFKINPRLEFIDFLYRYRNRTSIDVNSYSYRFQQFFGRRNIFEDYPELFLSFLLSLGLKGKYLIGTTDPLHLSQIARIENQASLWSDIELNDHIATWNELSRKYQWIPVV